MTAGIEIKDRPLKHAVSPKGMLIGGKWVEAKSGARITVENPAKRVVVTEVPRAASADVDAARRPGESRRQHLECTRGRTARVPLAVAFEATRVARKASPRQLARRI